MKTYVHNGRESWTRRVKCAACGESVRHFEASWDRKLAPRMFGVPYAVLNGGIHHEIEIPEWFEEFMAYQGKETKETVVYLSECCEYPHCTKRGPTLFKG